MKVVISSKDGKTYVVELPKEKESLLYGTTIGQAIDGSLIGAAGYKFKMTGGSDKYGFPMRPDVSGTGKKRIFLSDPPGFHPKRKGEKKRKMVRGNTISEIISQVNLIVSEIGQTKLSDLFGRKEEKKEGEGKEEIPTKKQSIK